MSVSTAACGAFQTATRFAVETTRTEYGLIYLLVLAAEAEKRPWKMVDMKRPKLATKSLSTFGVWEDDCAVCEPDRSNIYHPSNDFLKKMCRYYFTCFVDCCKNNLV